MILYSDRTLVILALGAILLASCASAQSSAAPPTQPDEVSTNPWAGKSGKAQALADIAAGRPVRLYLHFMAGERAIELTPGLNNCNPERFDVSLSARSRFIPLGEDFHSDRIRTGAEIARQHSALVFARTYNLTMFRKRKADVLFICPSAEIDEAR